METVTATFLLPKAIERNVGVIAMKVLGHGELQVAISPCALLSDCPESRSRSSQMATTAEIDAIVEIAAGFRPLDERDQAADRRGQAADRTGRLWRAKRERVPSSGCTTPEVRGWSQKDEPALVDY
jgi:hypothetical protein